MQLCKKIGIEEVLIRVEVVRSDHPCHWLHYWDYWLWLVIKRTLIVRQDATIEINFFFVEVCVLSLLNVVEPHICTFCAFAFSLLSHSTSIRCPHWCPPILACRCITHNGWICHPVNQWKNAEKCGWHLNYNNMLIGNP